MLSQKIDLNMSKTRPLLQAQASRCRYALFKQTTFTIIFHGKSSSEDHLQLILFQPLQGSTFWTIWGSDKKFL